MTVGPIVTDADRKWALYRLPQWMDRRGDIDGVEDEGDDDGDWLDVPRKRTDWKQPSGPMFVAEQAEAFERFFVGQYKTYAEWSTLWRKSWWPKADPARRFPHMAPKVFHPFFKRGSKEFDRAMDLGTPEERRMWALAGVAQFKPEDPRISKIEAAGRLTDTSKRMTGERE